MKPVSARDHVAQIQCDAEKAFASHALLRNDADRWRIGRPGSSTYWADIVAMSMGGLVVWGDIELVCFAYGPKDPVARVHWMTTSDLSYVQEKAQIGSRHRGVATQFDPGVALHELRARIEESVADGLQMDARHVEAIEDAIVAIRRGDGEDEMRRILYDAGLDTEWLCDVGVVTSTAVIYAHAAVKRLAALLEEKAGKSDE